jgi:hypothetical protein
MEEIIVVSAERRDHRRADCALQNRMVSPGTNVNNVSDLQFFFKYKLEHVVV